MLTITFAPDGSSGWGSGLILCNTSRSLAELEVKFNHKRIINVENLAQALGSGAAGFAQDFGNVRNTLSLRVRRGVDFTATAFADPEAALIFALDQPALFTTSGALKLALAGVTTTATRYLLNVGVEGINLGTWLGVAPDFEYTFNGGLISSTSPF